MPKNGSWMGFEVVVPLPKAFPVRRLAYSDASIRWCAIRILDCMDDLAQLRKSYERAELDESASLADPTGQFELWLQQAIDGKLPEPNAMTLATVGEDGRPSTRVVLIKGVDARGIVWYTNYESRKGRELAIHPHAALQFHWVEL